jgi:hypothetical protein
MQHCKIKVYEKVSVDGKKVMIVSRKNAMT